MGDVDKAGVYLEKGFDKIMVRCREAVTISSKLKQNMRKKSTIDKTARRNARQQCVHMAHSVQLHKHYAPAVLLNCPITSKTCTPIMFENFVSNHCLRSIVLLGLFYFHSFLRKIVFRALRILYRLLFFRSTIQSWRRLKYSTASRTL